MHVSISIFNLLDLLILHKQLVLEIVVVLILVYVMILEINAILLGQIIRKKFFNLLINSIIVLHVHRAVRWALWLGELHILRSRQFRSPTLLLIHHLQDLQKLVLGLGVCTKVAVQHVAIDVHLMWVHLLLKMILFLFLLTTDFLKQFIQHVILVIWHLLLSQILRNLILNVAKFDELLQVLHEISALWLSSLFKLILAYKCSEMWSNTRCLLLLSSNLLGIKYITISLLELLNHLQDLVLWHVTFVYGAHQVIRLCYNLLAEYLHERALDGLHLLLLSYIHLLLMLKHSIQFLNL